MSSFFVKINSLRFHALRTSGTVGLQPVLLLHGFNQTAYTWSEFIKTLEETKKFDVVALDQRGHGDSEYSKSGDYAPETMVDDVEQLRQQLGFERMLVVGFSMGAGVASLYAATHRSRVQRLVLVDYAPRAEDGGVDKLIFQVSHAWPSFDEAVDQVCLFNPRRTRENIADRLSHSLYHDTSSTPSMWRFKGSLIVVYYYCCCCPYTLMRSWFGTFHCFVGPQWILCFCNVCAIAQRHVLPNLQQQRRQQLLIAMRNRICIPMRHGTR